MILYLFVVALVAHSAVSLDTTKTLTSQLHEFQLNNSAGVMSALDMLPKECSKNGKKYKPDESFEIGNLRYKCQNYGVYTIEGCKRKDGTEMKLGESVVVDNVKHQCLGMGSSVFYKETTCGVMGQPECDKIPLPKGFEEAMKRNGGKTETQNSTVEEVKDTGTAENENSNKSAEADTLEKLTEEDMKMMDQFNKTMEADEEMQRSNETVLGIDTFGAQGI
ncbi:hypothetical protein CRE_02570 [Caenorhabditis remanei]|uniref:Abnormal cell migration protein 18-like fibronectin type I domain-containing protein n=1 Tax=Caenorhabditis remanei TaxID=31234 RepID=E3N4V6_CAERE|nr:hypothetical protein CRE_02570 [Caenorhabditis remanei]